jgi:DnaJ-domain-containing protein 1
MSGMGEHDPRRMIVRLAVAMMAADGRISPGELSAAEALDRLGLGPLSSLAREEINRAAERPIDLGDTCAGLARLSPEGGRIVLSILAEIAAADGVVSSREREMLREIASLLLLPPGTAEEALSRYDGPLEEPPQAPPETRAGSAAVPENSAMGAGASSGPSDNAATAESLARAYALLGVRPGASRAELESAYRAALERYNPNKVIDLGTEFASLAVQKLTQATAAFEFVLAAARPGGREGG